MLEELGRGRRSFGRLSEENWGGRRSFGRSEEFLGMTIIIILQVLWGPGDPVNSAVTQPKSFPGEAGFIMQIIPIGLVARPD